MEHQDPIDLTTLLKKFFDDDELRRWIYKYIGPDVYNALPRDVDLTELAFQTARILERHGRIDCDFWDALKQTRPQHAAWIHKFEQCWPGLPVVKTMTQRRRAVQIVAAIAIVASTVIVGLVLIKILGSIPPTLDIATPVAIDAGTQMSRIVEKYPKSRRDARVQGYVRSVSSKTTRESVAPSKEGEKSSSTTTKLGRRFQTRDSEQAVSRNRIRPQPAPNEAPSSVPAKDSMHKTEAQDQVQRATTKVNLSGAIIGQGSVLEIGNVYGSGATDVNAENIQVKKNAKLEAGNVDNE